MRLILLYAVALLAFAHTAIAATETTDCDPGTEECGIEQECDTAFTAPPSGSMRIQCNSGTSDSLRIAGSGYTLTFPAVTATVLESTDTAGGDLSGTFGALSLGADVVAAAEMADADHGDISWSGGVASIDADVVGSTELNDTDTPADEECLTFESTGSVLEWQPCSSSSEWTDSTGEIHPSTTTNDVCNDASCTNWRIQDTGEATFASITAGGNSGTVALNDSDSSHTVTLRQQANMTANVTHDFDSDGLMPSSFISTEVRSMYWGAGAISADGTQCGDPAEVTVGSWGKTYAIICTDNDAATMTGTTVMPDGWDAGTVTFALNYIQDAADTSALNADVAARCVGDGETPAAYGTEIAIDDAAVTGTDAKDETESAAVTAAGTCAAGDMLQWQIQLDATGTTTAVATLNFIGVKMEYTSDVGD